MKNKILMFIFLVLLSFKGFADTKASMGGEMTVNKEKLLNIIRNQDPSFLEKFSTNDYEVNINEAEKIWIVFFSYKNKPKGYRGAMPEKPEPIFEIDKSTHKIINQYYNR